VLWPHFPLVKFIIFSQVMNGVLLPVILIFMLILINKKELMGKHTNGHWFNGLAWATALIVIALTVVMIGMQLTGHGG
jgi:Mn2+/Fe2+ NRAMP family transporter